jgi:hypothetical protein
MAKRLLERAMLLAPGDPAIANNIAVMDAGLAYFSRLGTLRSLALAWSFRPWTCSKQG